MGTRMQVIHGLAGRPRSPLRSAYEHFRLERQGDLVSPKTLDFYHYMLEPLLGWLEESHPAALGFEDLDINLVRAYRAELAGRPGPGAGPQEPGRVPQGAAHLPALGAARGLPGGWPLPGPAPDPGRLGGPGLRALRAGGGRPRWPSRPHAGLPAA